MDNKNFDVIIIGGSYAGLSAAMSLGRALRNVLIIDSGNPCNKQTPYSHNFITHDGEQPAHIAAKAKEQVLSYPTVTFINDRVENISNNPNGFDIYTIQQEYFFAKKILFATGIRDVMPVIYGFSACWGISILHCPYCHGYEVRNEQTGLFGNGDMGFEFAKMIRNWTEHLTLFTNGKSTLTSEQQRILQSNNIPIVENEIIGIEHEDGYINSVILKNVAAHPLKAAYAKPAFTQQINLLSALGCTMTEHGFIQVDPFQKTTVSGIYAAGDNSTMMRSLASAAATGSLAGAMINKELIDESYNK